MEGLLIACQFDYCCLNVSKFRFLKMDYLNTCSSAIVEGHRTKLWKYKIWVLGCTQKKL